MQEKEKENKMCPNLKIIKKERRRKPSGSNKVTREKGMQVFRISHKFRDTMYIRRERYGEIEAVVDISRGTSSGTSH